MTSGVCRCYPIVWSYYGLYLDPLVNVLPGPVVHLVCLNQTSALLLVAPPLEHHLSFTLNGTLPFISLHSLLFPFPFCPLCVSVCDSRAHVIQVFIYQLCMVELEGKRGNRVIEKLVLLLSALITRHHHNVSVFSSAFIKQTHCSGTACMHACVCVLCTETDGAITTTEGAPERFWPIWRFISHQRWNAWARLPFRNLNPPLDSALASLKRFPSFGDFFFFFEVFCWTAVPIPALPSTCARLITSGCFDPESEN